MSSQGIDKVVSLLRDKTAYYPESMTKEIVSLYGKNPYLVLISCLLSLQNRDIVTLPVTIKLFKFAQSPEEMLQLRIKQIEEIIHSINYYKTKAQRLHSVSRELIDRFNGKVPNNSQDLLSIKGIGLKTANLVLAEAFDIPAICVDTHVHRLSNHWGLIKTQTPEQTEVELKKIIPTKYWIDWNYLLVKWGQHVCKKNGSECGLCVEILTCIPYRDILAIS